MIKKTILFLAALYISFAASASAIDGLAAFDRGDYERAEKELIPSALAGNDDAQVLLARICILKSDKKNNLFKKEAVRYLRLAIAQGNNEAKSTLGAMYLNGNYVDKNIDAGIALITEASDQMYLPAIVLMAGLYKTGTYVEQDYAKALDMYQRGAAIFDAGSMLSLADMYDMGYGVEKDQFKAFHYVYTAASTLNEYGQLALGLAYEYGNYGIKKDQSQAIRWYKAAAFQGNSMAKEALTRLGVKK